MIEALERVYTKLKGTPAEIITARRVPERPTDENRFVLGEQYFVAHLNQMHLTQGRKWLNEYYPIVLCVSEYYYDNEFVSTPMVVGPAMIEKYIEGTPEGNLILSDTQIAGIFPFTGKKMALTVILAQVRKTDYTRNMLKMIERTAGVFFDRAIENSDGFAFDVASQFKIANALVGGVEDLLGIQETTPLIGQRFVFDQVTRGWMHPGFYAMLRQPMDDDEWSKLSVEGARLRYLGEPFSASDFMLVSFSAPEEREDATAMFEKRMKSVTDLIWAQDEAAVDKARAAFFSLSADILSSPDLTYQQRRAVHDHYIADFKDNRDRRLAAGHLGPETTSPYSGVATDDSDRLSAVLTL